MAYTEQITFLLFLKMADEQSKPPYNKTIVPKGLDWASLLQRDGEELEKHYRKILDERASAKRARSRGCSGRSSKRRGRISKTPPRSAEGIVELIDTENWSSVQADTKGDIYEGLLEKSAKESPKDAGQYFTPRELIKAIVDCVEPTPDDTVCDPACGTGGFLLAALDFVIKHYDMDKDQKKHLKSGFVRGWELVPNTVRKRRGTLIGTNLH